MHAGLRLLASQAITQTWVDVYLLKEACGSPIELPLALALVTVARNEQMSVKLITPEGEERGDRFEPTDDARFADYALRIEPQAQLGEHRVDFCVSLEGSLRGADARLRSASKRMVIECDRHEFHRTGQARSRARPAAAVVRLSRLPLHRPGDLGGRLRLRETGGRRPQGAGGGRRPQGAGAEVASGEPVATASAALEAETPATAPVCDGEGFQNAGSFAPRPANDLFLASGLSVTCFYRFPRACE
jgi:hypothetical protein